MIAEDSRLILLTKHFTATDFAKKNITGDAIN
jgi:hypothetical protein